MSSSIETGERRKRIAIVEDDPRLAEFFSDLLGVSGEWDVRIIDDGQHAHRLLPEADADVIILDVGLPGLDGVSLYKILKGHRQTRHIPIIMVTASYEWELERLGIRPALFLRKPFHLQEFLDVLGGVLEPARRVQLQ